MFVITFGAASGKTDTLQHFYNHTKGTFITKKNSLGKIFFFFSLICVTLYKSMYKINKCIISLSFLELKSTGTAHHFAFLLNSTDYRILRMDEDHDRMYVGSKDYILSLDLNDINKEPLIVRFLSYTIQIATNQTISKAWQQ